MGRVRVSLLSEASPALLQLVFAQVPPQVFPLFWTHPDRSTAAEVWADHHSISVAAKRHSQGCLQREVEDCLLLPFCLFREAIAENAGRSSRERAGHLRAGIGRSAKGLTIRRGHVGLWTAKESGAHLDAGRAQLEGGHNPPSIKYPARRDHWYAYRVHHHRDQGHRPDGPRSRSVRKSPSMSARLRALSNDRVSALLLEQDRLGHRGSRA